MMKENQREELLLELEKIQNSGIKKLVEKAFQRVPQEFWVAGASSTGKYHPKMSAGEGGLWRHTRAVVQFVQWITEIEQTPATDFEKDLLIGAALLHDSCKGGIPWGKYTNPSHPLIVFSLFKEEELDVEEMILWDEINFLISSHMGQWNTAPGKDKKEILPKPKSGLQKILHLADYLASRKGIDIEGISSGIIPEKNYHSDNPF